MEHREGFYTLGFPVVKAGLADPVLAAQIGGLHRGFVLFQDRNDLLIRVRLSLHRLVLFPEDARERNRRLDGPRPRYMW